MDISSTIEPKSDQLNAEDFLLGPRTFTVERVSGGTAEQPVNIHLKESPGKPWRPSKGMRRILVAVWGTDGDGFAGKRVTLYRDPGVKYGSEEVGGIKISHLSGIDKPVKIALTVTRGKRQPHTVEPLVEALQDSVIETAETVDELRALWGVASVSQQARIKARVDDLTRGASGDNAND